MNDEPIPMLLWCPFCLDRHIDTDEFATKPHHTHACQGCGGVWRPALIATVGVRFLPGFKNAVVDDSIQNPADTGCGTVDCTRPECLRGVSQPRCVKGVKGDSL